jgi:hypothetical protein
MPLGQMIDSLESLPQDAVVHVNHHGEWDDSLHDVLVSLGNAVRFRVPVYRPPVVAALEAAKEE